MNIPAGPQGDPPSTDTCPPLVSAPLPDADTAEAPRSGASARPFGAYRILQKLGEGGFGAVFEADQEHPVKRRVALKVIKLGMDTREVIARFEAERQALAMMDHPHIARVLDAGAADDGRPYFVMELVKGEPINSYCDKHRLSIVERLKLFEQVCHAVQHAHTKGVIHRDLKPNNVLVSTQEDRPFAKVIDFGIAKATSGRLTDKTLFTELHQMIGTPLYMSPEQAEGSADIDTRTDIYSLGVILYELLTGSTPFESSTLRSATYAEIQRIIRDVEPPRPSTRLVQSVDTLNGVAIRCQVEPRKLTRLVRGELDWIVMKAIDKDRARRYETANGLAFDVQRYLKGERVLAAPPSVSYRLRKFVARNRVTVAAGMMVAMALLVGIAGFAWQARVAQERAAELEQVSGFQAEMLGQVDPTQAGKLLSEDIKTRFDDALAKSGLPDAERAQQAESFNSQWDQVNATDAARALIDRTILKPAVEAIDEQFKDQPVVDASLRQVLARRYRAMGLYDLATPLQNRALTTRQRVLGEAHPDTLTSLSETGLLLWEQGKFAESEKYLSDALERRRRELGADHPDTVGSLAEYSVVLLSQGKVDHAEPFAREALEKLRRVRGETHTQTMDAINNLGYLLRVQKKLGEAEGYYREALDTRRRVLGVEHRDTLTSVNNLGALLRAQGKLIEAAPLFKEALQMHRRSLGEDHPDTLRMINNLAVILKEQGKLDEAGPHYLEALEKSRRVLGDDNPFTLVTVINLSSLRVLQGRYDETIQLLTAIEPQVRATLGTQNPGALAALLLNLGKARSGQQAYAVAEPLLLEAHELYVPSRGAAHVETIDCMRALVALYASWHAAQPDGAHDVKRAQWQAKLDMQTTVDPAAATTPSTPPRA